MYDIVVVIFMFGLSTKDVLLFTRNHHHHDIYSKDFWGIVPFVATPLKGRFVVFLKWLFIGYFRLS